MGAFKKWGKGGGVLVMGDDFEMGVVDTPLWTMIFLQFSFFSVILLRTS